VQYLSLSWVMGIFSVIIILVLPYTGFIESARPGILHPAMLIGLTGTVFLQSIYPLSISMPAFLQMGRMWKYAIPAIIMFSIYALALIIGVRPILFHSWTEVFNNLFTSDLILRIALLILSIYYIVNIFRLPRHLLKVPDIHGYVIGYTMALAISSILYVWATANFGMSIFKLWVIAFTLVNLYLCLRVLETLALSLPKPVIKKVEAVPEEEVPDEDHEEDFNEANYQRFERLEFWMQQTPSRWKVNTFGRDQLCEAVGINRHLALQALRSQGYNNVHEYINTYRINELERMIIHGEIKTLRECEDAGFGTIKTARSCYEKMKGDSLDEFFARSTSSRS